jgi:hypothetical protein
VQAELQAVRRTDLPSCIQLFLFVLVFHSIENVQADHVLFKSLFGR